MPSGTTGIFQTGEEAVVVVMHHAIVRIPFAHHKATSVAALYSDCGIAGQFESVILKLPVGGFNEGEQVCDRGQVVHRFSPGQAGRQVAARLVVVVSGWR